MYINEIDINLLSLKGYWTFSEGEGQFISDFSLSENNGYLGNSSEVDNSDPLWDNINLGDINNDGNTDILDIILIVNIVLSNEYNESADMNSDGIIDILDIIQLVNIILNN